MFTQIFVIGTMDRYGAMSIHQDKVDYANSLINFRYVSVKDGYTVYFDGISKTNDGRC